MMYVLKIQNHLPEEQCFLVIFAICIDSYNGFMLFLKEYILFN